MACCSFKHFFRVYSSISLFIDQHLEFIKVVDQAESSHSITLVLKKQNIAVNNYENLKIEWDVNQLRLFCIYMEKSSKYNFLLVLNLEKVFEKFLQEFGYDESYWEGVMGKERVRLNKLS